MAIDVHVHMKGGEDGRKILQALDQAKLERIVLMSPPPHWSLVTGEYEARGHREVIDELARAVELDPQRLIGFAWIEPTMPDSQEMVDYALGDKGLHGIKMLPHHWYPDDERAQACYRKIDGYGKPMLFHSGVVASWGNTSKYCRPAEFEIMMEYPKIRFALAHMSWPWTDECIATCWKLQWLQPERGHQWTCYIDITTGAPRIWKVDALTKALAQLGDEHLIYGSDCDTPENADSYRWRLEEDRSILRDAGASPEAIERIFSRNALSWLGIS